MNAEDRETIPQQESKPERSPGGWLLLGLRVLFLIWALLIVVYFWRTNLPLWGIFAGLFGPWFFSLANTPLLEIPQALISCGLTFALGWLIMRALDVYLPRWLEWAIAWPVGFGVSGIAFELLTMAGWLYPLPAWLLWIVMLGAAGWLAWRRRRQAPWVRWNRGEPPLRRDRFASDEREEPRAWLAPPVERWAVGILLALVGLITLTTFWHALFYPETYWDSLILYLGYGRMTFLEHAFPFKAEAQVGIGLGANYPHLYSNFGAISSTLFDHWSSLHQRLAAPIAGAATCCLIYAATLELWRSHLTAASLTLLFRAIPYGIAYSTYASDYAFAILFAAAFAYLMAHFARTRRPGSFVLLTLIPAIGMHLNYLMGLMWIPWLVGVLIVAYRTRGESHLPNGILGMLRTRLFWAVYLFCVAAALPWYARNGILTNNPVYAFFPEIFTSSVRVNTEVLRSAELEWFRNGDGIAHLAEMYYDFDRGREVRDTSSPEFTRQAGFSDRLAASWAFWIGYDILRLTEDETIAPAPWWARIAPLLQFWEGPPEAGIIWRHHYKMNPLFAGFVFPAILLLPFALSRSRWFAEKHEDEPPDLRTVRLAVLGAMAVLFFGLLGYNYLLADFYLYQIIPILVPGAILATLVIRFAARGIAGRWLAGFFAVLCFAQGLVPGLAMGLLNFKVFGPKSVMGQTFDPFGLDVFRSPGLPPEIFYRLRFDDDPRMWDYVNERLTGEKLLTHENRHYVFDPSITFVHLDDWEMQQLWDLNDPEKLREELLARDIRWYLRVPNEENHRVNRRLGMEGLIEADLAKEVYRAGGNVLFRIEQE